MPGFDGLFNKTINSVELMDINKRRIKVGDSVKLNNRGGSWKVSKIKGETVVLTKNLQTKTGEVKEIRIPRGEFQLNAVQVVGGT